MSKRLVCTMMCEKDYVAENLKEDSENLTKQ